MYLDRGKNRYKFVRIYGQKTSRAAVGERPAGFRCYVISLVFVFLLSRAGSAQQFCAANSSIDWVPFFIGQTYADILNRAPDRKGQLFYISSVEGLNTTDCKSANAALSAGACEWSNNAKTILSFLSSPESVARNDSLSNNTSFVLVLYKLLLRDPYAGVADRFSSRGSSKGRDKGMLCTGCSFVHSIPSQFSWYVSRLDAGATRLSVVLSILSSNAYRNRFICTYGAVNPSCNGAESVDPVPSFVTQSYRDILNRVPDGAGFAWWTRYMTTRQLAMCANTSASDFSVCDRVFEARTTLDFFESAEYHKSHPPITQNGDFVTALYQHLLQRHPDDPGLQLYTKYLNETNDRLGTIYHFLTSDEYRKRFACYAGARDQLNFGINGHPFVGPAYSNSTGVSFATQLSLIQDAGLKWYRVDASAPGSGGDYSQLDLLLSMAQADGIQLLPIIVPAVNLGTDTLDKLYSESYAGAFDIVRRYKSSIHVWELWNEADVYSIKAPTYNGVLVSDYDPTRLAQAVAILHGLADGARAADPECLRIINFGWIHTGFIQTLENDAVPFDILGVHWYANSSVIGDPAMGDITCPGQNLPCPSQLIFFNLIERLQSLTNGKPLWLTENNYWPLIPSNSVSTNITWEDDYLPSMLQTYLNFPSVYPYQVVMIYELLDEPYLGGGPFHTQLGLYQVTESENGYTLGPPKPVYQSVQQLLPVP